MTEGIQPGIGLEEAVNPEGAPIKGTIRSHHLLFAGWAMGLGELAGTPQAVAEAYAAEVERWKTSKDPYARWYYATTIAIDKQGFINTLASDMQKFLDESKDENKEYTIVENKPDTFFCKNVINCGFGKHCGIRRADLPSGDPGILDESRLSRQFLDAAEEFGLLIDVEWSESKSTDTFPVISQVRSFTLSAGQIKAVLTFMAGSETYRSFFDNPYKNVQ